MLHLYCITNKINGKKYVGITKQGADRRFRQHISDSKRYKTVLHNAIRKHGPDSFSLEILCKARSYDELMRMEKETIESLNTMHPNGYNMTYGGDANWRLVSDEAMKDRARKAGDKLLGFKHSKDFGEKISRAKKGKPLSDTNLEAIRKSKSKPVVCIDNGMVFYNGHEAKKWLKSVGFDRASYGPVVAACRGRAKTAYGFRWKYKGSPAPIHQEKRGVKRRVRSIDIPGIVFDTVSDAVRYIAKTKNPKASSSSICKAASGKLKSAYGFRWEYVD